jgi:hypothetical protein
MAYLDRLPFKGGALTKPAPSCPAPRPHSPSRTRARARRGVNLANFQRSGPRMHTRDREHREHSRTKFSPRGTGVRLVKNGHQDTQSSRNSRNSRPPGSTYPRAFHGRCSGSSIGPGKRLQGAESTAIQPLRRARSIGLDLRCSGPEPIGLMPTSWGAGL